MLRTNTTVQKNSKKEEYMQKCMTNLLERKNNVKSMRSAAKTLCG